MKDNDKEQRKVLLKYLALCRRQNKYIYVFNSCCIYTSMEEDDIIHYETTMAHEPIHKIVFYNNDLMNVFNEIFPVLEGKDICVETKLVNTLINKHVDLRDLKTEIVNGLIVFKNIPTLDNNKGGYKLLTAKEITKDVVYRDIVVGKIVSEYVKEVVENIIESQKQLFTISQRLDKELFNKSETTYIRYKEGDIESPHMKMSTAVNIPIWDGETTISVVEYVNKYKFDTPPEIIAELIVIDKSVQLRVLFKSDDMKVVSLHHRRWFPFR